MTCTPAGKRTHLGRERPTRPEHEAEMERPSTTEELRTELLERSGSSRFRRETEPVVHDRVLGRYQLERRIGAGRYGGAWQGRAAPAHRGRAPEGLSRARARPPHPPARPRRAN